MNSRKVILVVLALLIALVMSGCAFSRGMVSDCIKTGFGSAETMLYEQGRLRVEAMSQIGAGAKSIHRDAFTHALTTYLGFDRDTPSFDKMADAMQRAVALKGRATFYYLEANRHVFMQAAYMTKTQKLEFHVDDTGKGAKKYSIDL